MGRFDFSSGSQAKAMISVTCTAQNLPPEPLRGASLSVSWIARPKAALDSRHLIAISASHGCCHLRRQTPTCLRWIPSFSAMLVFSNPLNPNRIIEARLTNCLAESSKAPNQQSTPARKPFLRYDKFWLPSLTWPSCVLFDVCECLSIKQGNAFQWGADWWLSEDRAKLNKAKFTFGDPSIACCGNRHSNDITCVCRDSYVGNAEKLFTRWYGWARRSQLEPIKKVALSLKNHFDGLLSYFRQRVTNATAEGFNNRI